MTLHIGILAHSAEGATLCYRTIWMEGVARMGAHNHPEITLTGVAMHQALADWEAGNLAALRALFMADAEKLAAAGADFLHTARQYGPYRLGIARGSVPHPLPPYRRRRGGPGAA
jgi:aspartate/glutamate racemase